MFGDNNPVEELSEEIYKYQTGKEIEFSHTPEPTEPNQDINEKLLKDYETTYDECNKAD